MKSLQKEKFTVQGVMTPVPAVFGSKQAGSRPSSSNDRNAIPVNSLAGVADRATSTETRESKNGVNIFRRSDKLARSPPGTPYCAPQQGANVFGCRNDGAILDTPTSKNLRAHISTDKVATIQDPTMSVESPGENILRVSSKTKKIPVNSSVATVDVEENTQESLETPQGDVADSRAKRVLPSYRSPKQEFILKMRLSEEEALMKCQTALRRMRAAIGKQRNIKYRRNWKTAEREREASKLNKTQHEICQETPTNSAFQNKRSASSPAEIFSGKKLKRKASGDQAVSVPTIPQTKDVSKKKKGKKGRRKPRPRKHRERSEAVVIKPRDGHSYADVLKNLREKVKPEENQVVIQSVRKTKTGSILLVMGKGGKKDDFREVIRGTLKEKAMVQSLKSKATVEIQDLDSLTTEEEVVRAIHDVVKTEKEDISICLTATNSREQNRAFVSLPAADANTLLEKRRILIGWIYCRMRYRQETKLCYRCFESGHMQWDCKGPDRKSLGLFIKCGQNGHKMKECRDPRNAVFACRARANQWIIFPAHEIVNPLNRVRTEIPSS